MYRHHTIMKMSEQKSAAHQEALDEMVAFLGEDKELASHSLDTEWNELAQQEMVTITLVYRLK